MKCRLTLRTGAHPRLRWLFPILFATALTALSPNSILAQGGGGIDQSGTGGRNSINGKIYFPSGRRSDAGLKIKLESTNSGGLTVFSDSNGSFSFRNLEPGNYTVVVEGGDDYENVRESVYIEDMRGIVPGSPGDVPRSYTLPIYLQPKRNAAVATKATVINAELAAAPENARDLYQKAVDASANNDNAKAIDNLRAAINVYPNFPLALNELGVQYLKIHQPEKAVDPLKNAVALSPNSFTPRLNYGIALLGTKQFSEAEAQLRECTKRNDSSAIAHMYLGLSILNQHAPTTTERVALNGAAQKEFVRSIELGDKQVATSHYYLAGIYWGNREYKKAADELESYLKLSPNAPAAERKRAQDAIAELRKK